MVHTVCLVVKVNPVGGRHKIMANKPSTIYMAHQLCEPDISTRVMLKWIFCEHMPLAILVLFDNYCSILDEILPRVEFNQLPITFIEKAKYKPRGLLLTLVYLYTFVNPDTSIVFRLYNSKSMVISCNSRLLKNSKLQENL
jgi:hypothetical protein